MGRFDVVWDCGKPDHIECETEAEVDKVLNDLVMAAELDEHPYFDIWVYDGEEEVTGRFMARREA